jgi:hypothetical protein
MDKDKFEENLEEDKDVVGDNSFYINGAITIPEGDNWEEFLDEMLQWLESKGACFFGGTSKVGDKEEAARQILKETTGIEWVDENE